MKLRPALTVALCTALVACTSAGAPMPGERAYNVICQPGEQTVCTGVVGSRIKQEEAMCSCSSIGNIYQY